MTVPRLLNTAAAVLVTFSLAFITACSSQTTVDPWEAAKLAYKLKKRADVRKNLLQIPAAIYAARLALECKTDEVKCIEATQIIRFAFVLTEGEQSLDARAACVLQTALVVDHLVGIRTEVELKMNDAMSHAENTARLQARISEINQTLDSYRSACEIKH